LGLGINDLGDLIFTVDPKESLKPVSKVIKDFGGGNKKVGNVINQKKREDYMNEFKSTEKADHSKTLTRPITVNKSVNLSASKAVKKAAKKFVKDHKKRKKLIITGTHFPIDPKRHNRQKRIITEIEKISLRDKVGDPAFPNAIALLLRLFIENSAHCYLDAKSIPCQNPNGWEDMNLVSCLKSVLKDLEGKNLLKSTQIKALNKIFGDPKKLAHPNSMNDYVHNRSQIPSPPDLIDIWDSYQEFLLAIWENI
jgi:hypothetical protein